MGQNLRARLRRIRDAGKSSPAAEGAAAPCALAGGETASKPEAAPPAPIPAEDASWAGWSRAGHKVLKRTIVRDLPAEFPQGFPPALAILVPDFFRLGGIPGPGELLFFDLETTGLSGGAGTLAFLAAFGRFAVSGRGPGGKVPGGTAARARIQITQYLLLDYPGEADFIERVVEEFSRPPSPVAVTYNGKSFDSQILKTRCLMNGIMPPEYHHADLLHPSRRLWKRRLPDCSQATIEVSVLGLDRTGDTPGALAPEIWFSFLKTGENRELLSICDHNARDIQGLAALFIACARIAAEPAKSLCLFRFDEEALALAWNEALRKRPAFFGAAEKETGRLLLKRAAENGWPRAAFALALALFKKGRFEEARALTLKIAEGELAGTPPFSGIAAAPGGPENGGAGSAVPCGAGVPYGLRAAAFSQLAIDAEWRQRDPALAADCANSALAVADMPEAADTISAGFRAGLEKRLARLQKKSEAAALFAHNGLSRKSRRRFK